MIDKNLLAKRLLDLYSQIDDVRTELKTIHNFIMDSDEKNPFRRNMLEHLEDTVYGLKPLHSKFTYMYGLCGSGFYIEFEKIYPRDLPDHQENIRSGKFLYTEKRKS